jgi:hypothetical protein
MSKKKIIGITFGVIVLGVGALCAVAATKPDTFRVERSATINASADKIYPLINDFHQWNKWSPYDKIDPDMKRTFSGEDKGKGAVYEWDGDNNAGSGRMEIAESQEPNKVRINLDFTKPFEANNIAEFTMVPEGDATKVTWSMEGKNNFMCKIIQTFCNMDDMCGKDFTTGLKNIKSLTETPAS